MPTRSDDSPRPLPDRPNLRHLKDQAKDLHRTEAAKSLADAQFQIARSYGFASWPKLKAHVESLTEIGRLKLAIDAEDFDRVRSMMSGNPDLHRAPMGYGGAGPLTWVAECRVPWRPPSAARLAAAARMIADGSDVHQGGDAPLMRAALNGDRVPMMELLAAHGADVNALWNGNFPIIFAPCESVQPAALKWLLDRGANPNPTGADGRPTATALDYLIETYARSPRLGECIDILLDAGGTTRYGVPAVLEVLRGRSDRLIELLDADPTLIHRRFPELDFGSTGARRLTLKGAMLLHVAAEYGNCEAVKLLLDRGADANARAEIDGDGVGGQTPIFHAVAQFNDWGLPAAKLLAERGADLSVRAKLPGHYDRPDEFVECTPLGYAEPFPGGGSPNQTVTWLRELGAIL